MTNALEIPVIALRRVDDDGRLSRCPDCGRPAFACDCPTYDPYMHDAYTDEMPDDDTHTGIDPQPNGEVRAVVIIALTIALPLLLAAISAPAITTASPPAYLLKPRPMGMSDEELLREARAALLAGKDMAAVANRLRQWGIDPRRVRL